MDEDGLMLHTPLYLLHSTESCWRCHNVQPVVALAAAHAFEFDDETYSELAGDDMVVLHNLRELPREILDAIHRYHPKFQKRYSKTAECQYYMNICSCGAHFGDFFLHSDAGSAFLPLNEGEARHLKLRTLPLDGEYVVNASFTLGCGSLILECAERPDEATDNQAGVQGIQSNSKNK
jgi:hypothetical protein